MHIVPDQVLGDDRPALWKVLAAGIVLGIFIARIFELGGSVRVVRFVDLPKPEGGR
jgi:uncharacterized membrane-anchored protein YitT (DUF2179 family)